MRVIIDKDIPFLNEVFPLDIEVLHLAPEEITSQTVRDADALFVRTRTRIDKELLEGSRVRFVATATIGFDHIDQDFCRQKGIHWTSCPGCNAQAVCDYVEEALATSPPRLLASNNRHRRLWPCRQTRRSDGSKTRI